MYNGCSVTVESFFCVLSASTSEVIESGMKNDQTSRIKTKKSSFDARKKMNNIYSFLRIKLLTSEVQNWILARFDGKISKSSRMLLFSVPNSKSSPNSSN